ncbi:hypothetical protein [Catenuloplanes atrovinosus]|uniref:Uncharacterized protein n=1 Tax=Catenuloplanes atrovinosus TaxID=137266 RepID=A0AAE3YRZ5_9ACTN|nr:hypothetical protein [Catenuloplanes atrovinosus]MDR7278555.1 hypothetical protein [Catenuloplanes atrovinosus]
MAGQPLIALPGRHRRRLPPATRAAVVSLLWLAVVVIAPRVTPPPDVRAAALFVHLISMLIGFGAVLFVDWSGILFLAGRRSFGDVLRTAEGALTPTWIGFTGLLGSGLLLSPQVTHLTTIKLLAVLVVGLNGIYAGTLATRLSRFRGYRPPTPLLIQAGLATALSQLAWWTAVIIGYLNSQFL